jgi:hypothetical protein
MNIYTHRTHPSGSVRGSKSCALYGCTVYILVRLRSINILETKGNSKVKISIGRTGIDSWGDKRGSLGGRRSRPGRPTNLRPSSNNFWLRLRDCPSPCEYKSASEFLTLRTLNGHGHVQTCNSYRRAELQVHHSRFVIQRPSHHCGMLSYMGGQRCPGGELEVFWNLGK